ncbi:PepSY domain-containing protein [Celeribacter neptunius]|uniref:Peptidase propeptide and YPEB domain-containing protein n=1 Tax=Celeribacter neptunius TaxID=588602 RepID=A0A1I3Y8T2_9RHOB|nr:PepSY domain-containing protein [Celeribacter neptunius]SFK28397.1 Peptidase propeptide and YPEB domain-containing protein [Celeribacter neptunius]
MKKLIALAMLLASPAFAEAEIDSETVARIEALLAEMQCQMDPDDIEVEDEGYDLDDVICEGGRQFDITLDKDLNETGRRAE